MFVYVRHTVDSFLHTCNRTRTTSSRPYTALCPVGRDRFAHFNASYGTLNSFFCNVVLEIPFIFLAWRVNRSNFDLLASYVKKLCKLICKIIRKKFACRVHFQLLMSASSHIPPDPARESPSEILGFLRRCSFLKSGSCYAVRTFL